MNAPIDYRLTSNASMLRYGAAVMRADAAATKRARIMLMTKSWRDVAAWLKGLEREVEGLDADGMLELAGRLQRGER